MPQTTNELVPNGPGSFIEVDGNGTPLGEWKWNPDTQEWVFNEYPPLGTLPQTGMLNWPVPVMSVGGILLFSLGWIAVRNTKKENG